MKKFIPRKYFEIWADEQSQNSLLKGLLAFFTIITITLIITITILSSKKPLLITLQNSETKIINSETKISQNFIQNEIKTATKKFIKLRHNWNYKDIDKKIKKSSELIHSSSKSKFLKKTKDQVKTAKKKKIIQRFYISSPIKIYKNKKELEITGDRILIVEGLRATQPMTFKINYAFGDRTPKNPEGVYITDETLISSLNH